MIATLAKVPLAFGSVHKCGRTPTDQSPVWQGPSHFQWDARRVKGLHPMRSKPYLQPTLGDCDYASAVPLPCVESLPWEFVYASHCLICPPWQCTPSPTHLICIALEGTEGIGGAMAFEVVPTAAGRLHSDQYTKIIIINTPINLQSSLG